MPSLKDLLEERLRSDPSKRHDQQPADIEGRLTAAKLGLTHEALSELVKEIKPPYDRVPVFQVIGHIDRIKLVLDMSGKRWPALYSAAGFEGQNLITGEVMRSRVCFLPGDEHENAVGVLKDQEMFDPGEFPEYLKKAEEERTSRFDTHGIEFALVFSIKPAKGAYGYKWVAHEITPVRKADPLAALRAKAMAWAPSIKAMPLPERVIEHEPAPAPEAAE